MGWVNLDMVLLSCRHLRCAGRSGLLSPHAQHPLSAAPPRPALPCPALPERAAAPCPAPPARGAGSSMLIPVPGSGGAVVVGESVLTFISAHAQRSTAIKPTMVKVRAGLRCPGKRRMSAAAAAAADAAVLPLLLLPTPPTPPHPTTPAVRFHSNRCACRRTVKSTPTASASSSQTTLATCTSCCCCARAPACRPSSWRPWGAPPLPPRFHTWTAGWSSLAAASETLS